MATTTAPAPTMIRQAPNLYDRDGRPTARFALTGHGPAPIVLTCYEIAMALHHSRAELHHGLTASELAARVFDGVEALGGVTAVQEQAEAAREMGRAYLARTETPGHRARWRRLWPHGKRREDRALALSWTVADYGTAAAAEIGLAA